MTTTSPPIFSASASGSAFIPKVEEDNILAQHAIEGVLTELIPNPALRRPVWQCFQNAFSTPPRPTTQAKIRPAAKGEDKLHSSTRPLLRTASRRKPSLLTILLPRRCIPPPPLSPKRQHWPKFLTRAGRPSYGPNQAILTVANPFRIEVTPSRGKTMVANRDVMPGDLIFIEAPLILLPSSSSPNYTRMITLLPRQAQQKLLDFAGYPPFSFTPGRVGRRSLPHAAASAFLSCHVSILIATASPPSQAQSEHTFLGVFETLCSTVSHSCCPNTTLYFNEEDHQVEVRASTFIPKGTPITTSYVDPLLHREHRRAQLVKRGLGSCHCLSCSSSGDESDFRRNEISVAINSASSFLTGLHGCRALTHTYTYQTLTTLLTYVTQEHLTNQPSIHTRLLALAWRASACSGDVALTRKWVEQYARAAVCVGPESRAGRLARRVKGDVEGVVRILESSVRGRSEVWVSRDGQWV
ncbi:hypothetical protein FRB95_002123 [Tulasnella sp. JGI-2019a]|nr:hypothetical protein FRB95_002123 [Tulasnella sp. JGI-2019a]